MAINDAMVALYSTTLSAPTASVTIAGIPASGYRDLRLIMTAATSANSNNIMRVNGDSASNYTQVYAGGNGSSTTSGTIGTSTFMGTDSSAFTTTVVGQTNHIIDIMDYAASDKHKSILFRCNRAGGHVEMMAGRWASTSAISSITVQPYTGGYTWSTGSTFTLYGIKA